MKSPLSYDDFLRILDKAECIGVNGYIVAKLVSEPGKLGLGYVNCDEYNNCTVVYCTPTDEYFIEYGRLFVKHQDGGDTVEIRPLVLMRL
jgi:hypothetical protein